MKRNEIYLSVVLLVALLLFGSFVLDGSLLFFRLIVGIGLGYTLTRGYTGFAGSVNRAYKNGSTKLMRAMAFMFFITALLNTAFLFNADAATYDLWVNPINFGLILGGIMFGFGMSFASCCASGVLTDLVTGLPRALITLLFFGMGVFIGFPWQATKTWITDSWFTSAVGEQLYGGVYLPDLFKFDGLDGYLGAMVVTGLLCLLTVYLARRYENKRKAEGNYSLTCSEEIQCKAHSCGEEEKDKEAICYKLFVKPFTLVQAGIGLAVLFTLLMGVTKAGWGASTPYGFWFGKFLMIFGVSADSLAAFSMKPAKVYTMPFFAHPINTQNFGIIMGTLLYMLSSKQFVKTFKEALKINGKQALFYAIGGLAMGVGTRFSNGCNVGALYTPIANFSVSGWVFFAFLVLGGILGNMVAKKVKL